MTRSRDDDADRSALERAFADVKPLRKKSPNRITRPPEPRPHAGSRSSVPEGRASLVVERESNGIILGRRRSTHASILHCLEDPRLEVDAECDLHGLTLSEAERQALAFLRQSRQVHRRWVRIVVGKGLHSPGGKGAIKERVIETLSRGAGASMVAAFRTAPQRLGGTGALIVRLME